MGDVRERPPCIDGEDCACDNREDGHLKFMNEAAGNRPRCTRYKVWLRWPPYRWPRRCAACRKAWPTEKEHE